MEIIKAADGKYIVYSDGNVRVYDLDKLEDERDAIADRIASTPPPTQEELLNWAMVHYPMIDHTQEEKELVNIEAIIVEINKAK